MQHIVPLYTTRLRLDPLTIQDANSVFDGFNEPSLYEFIPQNPPLSAQSLAERYLVLTRGYSSDGQERWLNWVIRLLSTGAPIGVVELTVASDHIAKIAYFVFASHQRNGFAKEACEIVLKFVKDSELARTVVAEIDSRNVASIALAKALNFALVDTRMNADFFKESYSHELTYEKHVT